MSKIHEINDEFRGDNEHLRTSIRALIELSDSNSLVPHGLGGHARNMLAASYHRLENRQAALNSLKWHREIVDLADYDDDGATAPRHPLSWETIARMALDYSRAAIAESEHNA